MAGQIPQSFINDLLGRVDIVGVVGERVTLKKAGKDYQARCPFHDEKTPSFTVSQDKQFYYCFGCGASGTALTFLMEHERLPFVEAVETLAAQAGVEVPREHSGRPQRDNSALFGIMQHAEGYFRRQLRVSQPAKDYLQNRGVTGIVARDFGIGYAPVGWDGLVKALAESAGGAEKLLEAGLVGRNERGGFYDRFRERIQFPIRDIRGRVIGFGGRLLGDGDGPKYLNSPETPIFHKSEELYGLYEARKSVRNLNRLIVVEGYMDVVALAQYGVPNAVATLGTASGEPHYTKLYRYVDEVVCCFDGDRAGRRAAWRALENALPTLREGRRLKFMFLPEGEDPDTLVRKLGAEDFRNRLENAVPAIEYLFGELQSGFDLNTLDDRAKLASLATPHIQRVPAGPLRELMAARLLELTGLNPQLDAPPPEPLGRGSRTRVDAFVPDAADGAIPPDFDRENAPRRPASERAPRRGVATLSEKLLGRLLRRPELLQSLDERQVTAIVDRREGGLFRAVVKYLAKHPDADTARILGRWSGGPDYEILVELHRNGALATGDIEAETAEFIEGVRRLIAQADQHDRRRLMEEMHENPLQEKLVRFLSLKTGEGG